MQQTGPAFLRRTIGALTPAMALLKFRGSLYGDQSMGSYKRVFDPLDLNIIDLGLRGGTGTTCCACFLSRCYLGFEPSAPLE